LTILADQRIPNAESLEDATADIVHKVMEKKKERKKERKNASRHGGPVGHIVTPRLLLYVNIGPPLAPHRPTRLALLPPGREGIPQGSTNVKRNIVKKARSEI